MIVVTTALVVVSASRASVPACAHCASCASDPPSHVPIDLSRRASDPHVPFPSTLSSL